MRPGTWCQCRDEKCGHVTAEARMVADEDPVRCGSLAARMVTVEMPGPGGIGVPLWFCDSCAERAQ